MRFNLASVTLLGLGLFLNACSSEYGPDVKSQKIEGDTVFSSLPSLSETIVVKANANLYSCLGRGADATFNEADEGDFSLSLISVGTNSQADQVSNSESTKESEMSGRTPGVLMARELFFRTCEFSNNFKLTKKEALDLYMKTLDAVSQGWAAEIQNTTITVGETSSVSDSDSNTNTNTTTDSDTQSQDNAPVDQQTTTPQS